ncbi:beta-glucoside-specific PTS transporter subunit IIABC [Demequina capsici]|uniref:Beta-glucoside-specific PTS transporter subunit IIABC n=1 Tax=Demequina capsici TaxID=3075620 RepID=A0AA96J7I8_9MICO|nr:beta-glucoside-specific PTS transporter subunit IIABC [Demequina sp. OYTSA14]WNM24405.1 beta-glucoside-specific PTS transporter subunit IIABC [Demequina sp. OYTSA14]
MKYSDDAVAILEGVGGADNVADVFHCITRLRFTLKDESKADTAAVRAVPAVMGVNKASGQYQVIIGNDVPQVFEALVAEAPQLAGSQSTAKAADAPRKKWHESFFDFISGVFAPILPAIAGAGLLKGLLALLVFLNWIDATTQTYTLLSSLADSVFYLLPVVLAVTAARKLEANPYVAMGIAGALIYPGFTALLGGEDAVRFLGMPVTAVTYSYSVIPVLLAIPLMAVVERGWKRVIPDTLKLMFVPLLTMLVVFPITILLLGPLGTFVGNGVSGGINWLMENGGFLGGAIIGGLLPLIIMTGMHYALVPFILTNLANLGYDKFLPLTYVQTFATAGAVAGVAVRAKSKGLKALAASTSFTGFMGVTEPALYGIAIPLRRPLIATMIGGAAGGAISLGFGAKAFVLAGNGGIPGIPALIGDTFVWAIIAIVVAAVVAFVASVMLGFDESALDRAAGISTGDEASSQAGTVIGSPVDGVAVELASVDDRTFSQGVMGPGIAVVPANGEVVSPVAGTVVTVFPTGHALGLRTADGIDLLIHIGIDTVALGGKGFTAHVAQGDTVKAGDSLVSVDLDAVGATHDTTVIMVVTDGAADDGVVADTRGDVKAGAPLMTAQAAAAVAVVA